MHTQMGRIAICDSFLSPPRLARGPRQIQCLYERLLQRQNIGTGLKERNGVPESVRVAV